MNTETPQSKPAFSICVYCGSRPGNTPEFAAMARQVGSWIGRHDGQLVYGGGHNGLMGIMAEHANAFLALPGGIGTLEEFFEVWTWRQLGYHSKPVGLLNTSGYYDSLLTFLNASVKAGFMNDWLMELIRTDTQAEPLLKALVQAAGMTPAATRLDQI